MAVSTELAGHAPGKMHVLLKVSKIKGALQESQLISEPVHSRHLEAHKEHVLVKGSAQNPLPQEEESTQLEFFKKEPVSQEIQFVELV